jgi:HPt (histidine-containing phosphotransfer) domain-containing protein
MNKTLVVVPALPTADPLEGEPELRQELAGMFLEDYEKSLSKIRQSITDREASDLRSEAHALKGSTGVFRDQAAFAAAFQMEMIAHDATWDRAEATWEMLRAETLRLAAVLTRLAPQDEACVASPMG